MNINGRDDPNRSRSLRSSEPLRQETGFNAARHPFAVSLYFHMKNLYIGTRYASIGLFVTALFYYRYCLQEVS